MMFPYLRIAAPLPIGPWQIEPVTIERLEEIGDDMSVTIRAVLSHLLSAEGSPLECTTLLTRRRECPELADPKLSTAERLSVQVAVSFAIARANALDDHTIDWEHGPIATAEVDTLLIVPVPDGVDGFVSRTRGGPIAQILVSGQRLNDKSFVQLPPEGLTSIPELSLDPVLANAIYDVEITTRTADAPCAIHRVTSAALHWYSRAWENSPLRTLPDALVQLKTALEALSRESNSWKGSKKLEALYRAGGQNLWAVRQLWSADDPKQIREHNGEDVEVSAFRHWYLHLADLRNAIVHDTLDPDMQYAASGSPFTGNMFRVAERVARELISIQIARLGFPAVLLTPTERQALKLLAGRKSTREAPSTCTCSGSAAVAASVDWPRSRSRCAVATGEAAHL